MAAQYDFTVTLHDLAFILKQIKLSESANNADGSIDGDKLTALVGDPLLPYGIRTVDGSWNNLLPGQELFGSADQTMPRLVPLDLEAIRNDPTLAQYLLASGPNAVVNDADPRMISNIISDQSTNNPAAVEAAAGLADAPGGGGSVNGSLSIPNLSPDIGLSPAFNGWMTFFGQFFDHGLDLIPKAGNGIVFIPLMPDDPLYSTAPGAANFMILTRAKVDATLNTVNTTTPWIDQNQTYTSHPSHQIFLREYTFIDGKPEPTGQLLDGAHGIATWGEVKAHALQYLGIQLTDADISNVPLLATDRYGNLILSDGGKVQIVTLHGLVEANGGLLPADTLRTGHAFLDDIAHTAVPKFVTVDGVKMLAPDADNVINGTTEAGTYDNELLDRHFITGDGRGNENIGLTAVHSVFHDEHNRLVEQYKTTLLASGDVGLVNQWLMPGHEITAIPADTSTLVWNGEYLFQAGRFTTEMQYQHLVFEEFARAVQPAVDPFVFSNTADINPAIFAEFAHVVYRFGHSMLTETVDRTGIDMQSDNLGLIQAFLNPLAFDNNGSMDNNAAIGAIVRGMTRQVGNEIDEFLTGALRNNLVGLPLDLGALNIARGRDTFMPTLNQARDQFYTLTGNSELKPYTSWADFAAHLKNTASILNFMAAYGQHELILNATTIEAKRAAVEFLLFGPDADASRADAFDFFNSTGAWANKESGLNKVDFWIGGLAERKMEFGGMLGSTFNFVFETQMEMLQDGDRFYYLSRTQGLNMLNQLEANSFAALVMRNSDLGDEGSSHVHAKLFMTPDHTLEVNKAVQVGADPLWGDRLKDLLTPLVVRKAAGADVDGDGKADGAYLKYSGDGHVVLGGSAGNDTLIGGKGIDSLWGDAGNDRLDGGDEADTVHGGDGDDIITDTGTPVGGADFLHGDAGNDVIFSGNGNDLSFGGSGKDFIVVGEDAQEVFGGLDDDFILGGSGGDMLMGNEGDDWIEGGDGFDTLAGENSELFFNSTIVGHDVLNGQGNDTDYDGEAGDDIMVQGAGIQRNNGMAGFDWAIHKGDPNAANSDLGIPIFVNQQEFILRDRFDLVEGLSGWKFNDLLIGTDAPIGTAPVQGTPLSNNLTLDGVARINGLDKVVGSNLINNAVNGVVLNPDNGADILLGGGGSDRIMGKAGDDIIDGDAWLNVRIEVRDKLGAVIKSVDSMNDIKAELLNGTLNPGQLHTVREILNDGNKGEIDLALYRDVNGNYLFTRNPDGSLTVNHATVSANLPDGDGVDRLLNIEKLEFGDGTQLWVTAQKATGNVDINNKAPAAGDMLRVSASDVQDGNGLVSNLPIVYTWQALIGGQWRDQATGTEFRVGNNLSGAQLRVVASFTDRMGDAETLISAATSAVGPRDLPTRGLPVISDLTPTRNMTLTADVSGITDGDGLTNGNNFRYQWQMSTLFGFINIVGATAATYTPTLLTVDRNLRVVVTVTDDEGNPSVVLTSASTQTVGNMLVGGNGATTLVGTNGSDYLDGGNGNDTLSGLAGDDILLGGAGNDTLNGGAGADQMTGGTGNDSYTVDNLGDVVVEGVNGGTDTVSVSLNSYVMADNVENLIFTGSGNFNGVGNALANTMTGGSGNDTLNGMDGDDTLSGLAGNDTLLGGNGNDSLNGGVGADTLTGGAGNDIYIVDNVGDRVIEAVNGGNDTVRTSLNTYTLSDNVEVLAFTGTGGFTGTGNALNNIITGGNGVDRLNGGSGNDTLSGGGGNDFFIFGLNFGQDIITDFDSNPNQGQDLISLQGRGLTAANFASNVSIAASGTSTVLSFTNGDKITLLNTAVNSIQLNDFQLG